VSRIAFCFVLLSSVAYADVGQPVNPVPPRPMPPAPSEYTPYTLRLDVDLSLLILGTTLWGGTSFIGGSSAPPPWCGTMSTAPCDASGVNALDHVAIGFYNPNAALAANVLVGVVPGAFTILDVVDAGWKNWRGWMTDAVVITEAVVWSGALQDIVRRAVRRPRPFMYTPGLNPGAREGAEADFSFFSGHTSNTFAMVTAAAYTYTLRHPHSKWNWLVWSLAVVGESTEPVLRVLSGEHFPTDCIVGALVGTSAGILFPALHRRHIPIRVVSSAGPNGATVGVAGQF
jgi:membrane-associated phospholipid phosphatase